MQAEPPANEAERLEALRDYRILDTPPEPALDDITLLAAHVCGTPTALITFIDADRQWFKSRVGWAEPESSRDISFCAHAIVAADGGELIVPDASRDPRFSANPFVTSEPPAVRFYAGVPLVTSQGHALGALCVIDRVARTINAGQLEALRALRRMIVRELELRKTRSEGALVPASLAESSPDAILIHSDERILFANRALAALLRAPSVADLVGKPSIFMLPPEHRDAALQRTRALYAGEPQPRTEQTYLRMDGTRVHVEIAAAPFRLGERPAAHVTVRDVSERHAAQERIARLTRVHSMLSGINAAIVRIRDRAQLLEEACGLAVEAGRFRMAWIALLDASGRRLDLAASAGAVDDFFATAPLSLLAAGAEPQGLAGRAVGAMTALVANDLPSDPNALMKAACAARGIQSLAMIPLSIGARPLGVLALFAAEKGFFDAEELRLLRDLAGDISFALETIEKTARLDYLAYYDPLTGLANRALFLERLQEHLIEARRSNRIVALTLVDLERFKPVNDALGRQAGDELLRRVSERLRAVAGGPERLARVGADVFGVMTYDLEDAGDMARRSAQRAREIFGAPFRVGGREVSIAGKFGIAIFPADGGNGDELFRNAEAALKSAKSTGERFVFYAPEMNARVAEKLALEHGMRRALEQDQFVLFYQPCVETRSRAIVAAEALIRWRSPELGLVPPTEFIPLLEETGLILEVGDWALRRAAQEHGLWRAAGTAVPRVQVNVSPLQLRQPDFVDAVRNAIGTEPGVGLELTESLIMDRLEENVEKLRALRALGIEAAIDDFGTGYSSLSYLAKLPVAALKIDRSFVASMLADSNSLLVAKTVISLGHSLGLKVMAEGVETETQADMLAALGCDELQGYLFGRPVPADVFAARLRGPGGP